MGIANDGTVVGYTSEPRFDHRAFLWKNGVITYLGTFSGDSQALAVSEDGTVVVGLSEISPFVTRAFRWENGVMTDLGTLGGDNTYALAVSADGSVVAGNSN